MATKASESVMQSRKKSGVVRIEFAVSPEVADRLDELVTLNRLKNRTALVLEWVAAGGVGAAAPVHGKERVKEEAAEALRLLTACDGDYKAAIDLLREDSKAINPAFDWNPRKGKVETPEATTLRERSGRIRIKINNWKKRGKGLDQLTLEAIKP